uniref:Uncharacterized protein n=1 Tax=viral metagenome TaxID=1070528 RepID=A0A6C0HRL8_9ZZZZ
MQENYDSTQISGNSFEWPKNYLDYARKNPAEFMSRGIIYDYAASIENHDDFEMLKLSKSIYSMSIEELDKVKADLQHIDDIENHDYSFLCPTLEHGVTSEMLDKMSKRLQNITVLIDTYKCRELFNHTSDEEIENILQLKKQTLNYFFVLFKKIAILINK